MTATLALDPPIGVPTAFGAAILSLSPALQRFALRLTRNHVQAEDLVQDTLTRAWAARTRFDPGTNTRAWLFRIARNAFLSGVRRARRQVAWDPDRHHGLLVQEPTQHDAIYDRDLQAALSRLPATQRSAFLLVTHDGLSFGEAADELGVPSGTVKSRVGRARASILAYVDGDREKGGPRAVRSAMPVAGRQLAKTHGRQRVAVRPTPSRYQQWKASGATLIG